MKLSEITPEQKRIAIAEACGWDGIYVSGNGTIVGWMAPLPKGKEIHGRGAEEIPDYLNDLNAMASAEKTVAYEIQPLLLRELKREVMNYSEGVSDWDVYTATAAQRADAFLLATGRAEL